MIKNNKWNNRSKLNNNRDKTTKIQTLTCIIAHSAVILQNGYLKILIRVINKKKIILPNAKFVEMKDHKDHKNVQDVNWLHMYIKIKLEK